jgi:hypothetical protein
MMAENRIFVIPQNNGSIIARLDDTGISEIAKLDVPYHSKSVVTENGLIVSLCFGTKQKSRRLRIFDTNGKQLLRKTEYKYESISCKNNVVYLGGQYGSKNHEIFAFIDLSDINFSLTEVDLPVQKHRYAVTDTGRIPPASGSRVGLYAISFWLPPKSIPLRSLAQDQELRLVHLSPFLRSGRLFILSKS